MSSGQKIIKYIALALGIFLSVFIIYIIANTIISIASSSSYLQEFISANILKEDYDNSKFSNNISKEFEDVKSLKINCNISKLNIKRGDKFRVEAKNVTKDFKLDLSEDGVLNIDDKINSKHIKFKDINPEVTIYVNNLQEFNSVDINTGASNSNISDLVSNTLNLDLGAGNVNIKNVNVKQSTKIDSGVGNLNIDESTLNNLELDLGVGNTDISSIVLGKSKIECGVGNLNLTLNGNKEDYQINATTGLGNITIDGVKVYGDMSKYLTGDNIITIDGGMGNIKIYFDNTQKGIS